MGRQRKEAKPYTLTIEVKKSKSSTLGKTVGNEVPQSKCFPPGKEDRVRYDLTHPV